MIKKLLKKWIFEKDEKKYIKIIIENNLKIKNLKLRLEYLTTELERKNNEHLFN